MGDRGEVTLRHVDAALLVRVATAPRQRAVAAVAEPVEDGGASGCSRPGQGHISADVTPRPTPRPPPPLPLACVGTAPSGLPSQLLSEGKTKRVTRVRSKEQVQRDRFQREPHGMG